MDLEGGSEGEKFYSLNMRGIPWRRYKLLNPFDIASFGRSKSTSRL